MGQLPAGINEGAAPAADPRLAIDPYHAVA